MSAEHTAHDHMQSMTKRTLRLAFFLTMIILTTEVTSGLISHPWKNARDQKDSTGVKRL